MQTNIKTQFTQEHTRLLVHLSNNCESKIRTACQQFPNREWSGAAFYKINYLNDKDKDSASLSDIRIDVLDFCLQDVGSSGYTEYDLDENTASYLADHIDTLLGAKVALLHSHNAMKAFFSGTDINTLYEKAAQCNNVLSIVVNNDGNYVAKFTQKELIHQVDDITVDSTIDTSFSLLGESNRSFHNTQTDFKSEITDKYNVRIYDCDILRPLNMPIDEEFKQECIDKMKEIDLKRMEKKFPVENVIFKGTERYPFTGWLFNDYKEQPIMHTSNHDIDLLVRSILFLSLDIKSLKAPRHTEDVPLYHVPIEVASCFLDAWSYYFYPNDDEALVEEMGEIIGTLQRYFSLTPNVSQEVREIQDEVLSTMDSYKYYLMR